MWVQVSPSVGACAALELGPNEAFLWSDEFGRVDLPPELQECLLVSSASPKKTPLLHGHIRVAI